MKCSIPAIAAVVATPIRKLWSAYCCWGTPIAARMARIWAMNHGLSQLPRLGGGRGDLADLREWRCSPRSPSLDTHSGLCAPPLCPPQPQSDRTGPLQMEWVTALYVAPVSGSSSQRRKTPKTQSWQSPTAPGGFRNWMLRGAAGYQ